MASALVAAALAAATTALGAGPRAVHPGPPPKLFAFLSQAGGAELTHLRAYGPRISVLAPNWYALDPAARAVSGGPTPAVTAIARADGVAVWPVVNATLDGRDPFAAAGARARMAGAIAAVAARQGYPGMTLDIEQLPVSGRADFTRLAATVAARLHAAGRRLAVYVPRRTAATGAGAYDWRALAHAADLVIASGYNEHWSTGRAGPVTTAAGFAQMLADAAGVSQTKVAPAVGAFGYSWPQRGGEGEMLSTLAAQELLRQTGARLRVGGGDASFTAGGRVIHFQTGAELTARARDARDAGMRWLALFSLGREPAYFWSHVVTARQVPPALRAG